MIPKVNSVRHYAAVTARVPERFALAADEKNPGTELNRTGRNLLQPGGIGCRVFQRRIKPKNSIYS